MNEQRADGVSAAIAIEIGERVLKGGCLVLTTFHGVILNRRTQARWLG
jgi:hypothetical protein